MAGLHSDKEVFSVTGPGSSHAARSRAVAMAEPRRQDDAEFPSLSLSLSLAPSSFLETT